MNKTQVTILCGDTAARATAYHCDDGQVLCEGPDILQVVLAGIKYARLHNLPCEVVQLPSRIHQPSTTTIV